MPGFSGIPWGIFPKDADGNDASHLQVPVLRPTQEQAEKLDFLLAQARRVYNTALEQRIAAYQDTGKGIRYPAQWRPSGTCGGQRGTRSAS